MKNLTFLEVSVDLKGAHASVLGLSTSVDTLLLVYHQMLMADKAEGLIVPSAFTSVQLEHCSRSVSSHLKQKIRKSVPAYGQKYKIGQLVFEIP